MKATLKSPSKAKSKAQPNLATDLHYAKALKADFTAETNLSLKGKRIGYIGVHILRVWITRFIMLSHSTDDWGISEDGDEFVAWFAHESEADQCATLFEQIKNQGFPMHKDWTV